MNVDEIVKYLKSQGSQKNVEGMARFGIDSKTAFGVSMPTVRALAKKLGKNQQQACDLWKTNIHECRILAGLVAEPERMTRALADSWVADLNSWDVCDQLCMNLLDRVAFTKILIFDYCKNEEEFVRRTTFSLIAAVASHDKKMTNADFEKLFPLIIKHSTDERNFVRKAVNWALRGIGKRNRYLNKEAVKVAREILEIDSKSAKWIARDTIRELTNDKILGRIKS